MSHVARILVVDNYDSFVFNLVQYLGQLGAECEVRRNDEVTSRTRPASFDGVLLSPRSRHARAGRRLRRPGPPVRAGRVPIFGVCLGHQAIAVAYGGHRVRAPRAAARQDLAGARTRGRRARGLAVPFTATRYHSLAVRARDRAGRARGHRRAPARRRRAWRCGTATLAGRGRAVPPRVGADRGRPPDARQLARGVRRPVGVARSAGLAPVVG